MNKRFRWPPICVAGLFVIAGALAVSGQADGPPRQTEVVAASGERLPDLAGSWTGTWEDTIYPFSGGLAWEIVIDGQDMTGSGTIDLSSLGLGVMPGTAEGTITVPPARTTLDFTFTAASLGSGSGSITDNTAIGSGTVIAPLGFGDFTFQANVTNERMRGTFDFTSPGGGAGKVLMTKETPVDDSSWGVVKGRYRDGGE